MINSWLSREGSPTPLGVTHIPAEAAYNFALYSKSATHVTLLLYAPGNLVEPAVRHELAYPENKTGRVWHCRLSETVVAAATYYAYQIDGPHDPTNGFRFDPQKILLDPYAHSVFFPPNYEREAACRPGSNAGQAALGVIRCSRDDFDWGDRPAPRHGADTIIYEMHVKGFTAHPSSGVVGAKRGTFLGVVEKIPYLVELGVTVVELMPVQQFDIKEKNYWGYMTLNFFSPHSRYVTQPDCEGAQMEEFRTMVKAFHDAGIEVVLDVVYNHTTEGDEHGPTYSYRGIDNRSYYLLDRDRSKYRNDAGTGNVLNCANSVVRKMMIDSLRFWSDQMHVDGFRFDLASIFTRDADGSINLNDPPVIAEISTDPSFEGKRLIAEAWDLATYQLGRAFPGVSWLQWNGKFRDDIRRFAKGDNGLVGALMQRLYGSDDLFPDDPALGYRPYQSVNYICSHDGFSMYDLVSYDHKHNEENGNNNTDGTEDNYSWNCGWEGDAGVPGEILALRRQQIKNYCCLLMIANGTPMFMAGDEFMNTQGGNNNPYNQDDETTWLNWDLVQKNADMYRFWKSMIAFRKQHPSLARSSFWREDVRWFGVNEPVDLNYDSHTLAFYLNGARENDRDLYVMINAYWHSLDFEVQHQADGRSWSRVVDTGEPSPEDFIAPRPLQGSTYSVKPRSIVILERV